MERHLAHEADGTDRSDLLALLPWTENRPVPRTVPDPPLRLDQTSSPDAVEALLARWAADPGAVADDGSVLVGEWSGPTHGMNAAEAPARESNRSQSLAAFSLRDSLLDGPNPKSRGPGSRLELPTVGDEVFGFRLRQELGHGAFARVFLAQQGELADREVVLKISAIEGTEPQTLAQLQHTHIVPIYSVHEDPQAGIRAVCMPYLGGTSLSTILPRLWSRPQPPVHGAEFVEALESTQGPLPHARQRRSATAAGEPPASEPGPRDAGTETRDALAALRRGSYVRGVARMVAQLAEGLQHAHDRGVLHRDIKPSNILIGADAEPLLLDFNVSQGIDCAPDDVTLGGTIAYMAPEHLHALVERKRSLALQVDHRADLYSLGLVLYELLAGHSPFEQALTYSVPRLQLEALHRERAQRPPSVRCRGIEIPWSLESIVRKALAWTPADRYQSAADLADDLQRFLSDLPLRHAPELSRAERLRKWARRHPRLTAAGSVGLLSACLLATASTALLYAQARLDHTTASLSEARAHERYQRFQTGVVETLCLINTMTDERSHLQQGVSACERTLALFEVLERDAWQQHPQLVQLSHDDQTRIAEDVGELLVLLADGRVRLNPGRRESLDEALALLDRAERISGIQPSRALWLDRARYWHAAGNVAAAESAQQRARDIPASSARDHYLLATAQARKGTPAGYRQAVAALERALALDPRHYWSWFQRGLCHEALGDSLLAIADFSTCVGLRPDFAWGHFNRGYVFDQTGKKAEAVAAYSAALRHAPDFLPAWMNRGVAFLEMQNYAAALDDFRRVADAGRSDASVLAGQAMALEGLGRHAEADELFARAFEQAARLDASARQRLGWAYGFSVSARLPDEARSAFEDVLLENPRNPQAHYGLGMLEMRHGSAESGIACFARALEADPHFLAARRYRAIALARTGAIDDATREINLCLEREPDSAETLYAAACVAALAAERLEASALKEQAIELLRQAEEHGKSLQAAGDDPDLSSLRNNPRFRKLVPGAKPWRDTTA